MAQTISVPEAAERLGITTAEAYDLVFARTLQTVESPSGRRVVLPGEHERTRAGLNHLAFHAGDRGHVDALTAAAPTNGWTLMFPDSHPHAGGPQHYAAYLTDADGSKSNSSQTTHEQPIHRY